MPGCNSPAYTTGNPDLDNMISHAFAYGYRITGNTAYQDIAVDAFNTCVDHGWTGSEKHYNQQFRSSGHTVAYLTGGPTSTPRSVPSGTLVLHRTFPNPFNPQTTIAYTLPAAGHILVAVYDVTGRLVETLVDRIESSGFHEMRWRPAPTLPSGVYFVHARFGRQQKSQKIVLLK